MDAKINRKRTAIPAKQKNVIKLVMWTLYQVLDEETAKSKTFELLKLNESVENIIEQVDNIEKTEKYGEMETMMTAIRTNENVKKQTNVLNELSGDTDTIIKQMVEMATAEVKATVVKKPRAKKVATEATDETTETPVVEPKVKKPRAKKVAVEASTEATEATETPVVEPKAKKPRAKKVVEPSTESTEATETPVVEPKAKKPRAKKVAVEPSTESTETAETVVQTTETKTKKPRAKKVAEPATDETTEATEPKEKKPRAKKTALVVETPVKEEVKSTEDLQEEEYLVLNEIEYEGATYMVGTDQNVYDEFNAIIGKYENEKVILN
jgi:hypothetical protein